VDPDPGGEKCRVADPDWIRIQSGQWIRILIRNPDPDPDSESGSGSRRAKMTHKSRKKFVKVHVLKYWMASEGFFCNLDILYGGLGIG
jgi:hypothetical protein